MSERIILAFLALLIGLYYLLLSPWGIGLLFLFALLIVLLLISNIAIHLRYIRKAQYDEVNVHISALYGLVDATYRIPMIKLKGMAQGIKLKLNPPNRKSKAETFTRGEIFDFFHTTRLLLRHMKDYKEWVADTISRIHVEKVRWRTRFGVGEAAETAIASGIVWNVKCSIVSKLLNPLSLKTRPELSVEPVYNEICFETEAEARIRISVFHLLADLVTLVVRVVRRKEHLRVWRRVLLPKTAK